ncbi:MAG: alpha/beta hydrolase [Snowella sp.]|nr:alpha/beta hydrolase [Snowella sp.]
MIKSAIKKYNVNILGNPNSKETLVFAHGFGGNQEVWRFIIPAFQEMYRIVLFDLPGSLKSNRSDFHIDSYDKLKGFVLSFIDIFDELNLKETILVAHSVSCIISTLVAIERPDLIKKIVFISASPRYLNDGDYVGGLTKSEAGEILLKMNDNYFNWVTTNAETILGDPTNKNLLNEFIQSLLGLPPDNALSLFNIIIFYDCREEMSRLQIPVLIIQPENDNFVPIEVGYYLSKIIRNNQFSLIPTTGHLPHFTEPDLIISLISNYLNSDS